MIYIQGCWSHAVGDVFILVKDHCVCHGQTWIMWLASGWQKVDMIAKWALMEGSALKTKELALPHLFSILAVQHYAYWFWHSDKGCTLQLKTRTMWCPSLSTHLLCCLFCVWSTTRWDAINKANYSLANNVGWFVHPDEYLATFR